MRDTGAIMVGKVGSFAVVDTETTGVDNTTRVVELAVVLLDPVSLETIDEFDCLINPLRDVGPTRIHGITASMVSAAPLFEEVAPHVGSLLTGSVLVAHNLPFDRRMLALEFARLGGQFDPGEGICTLKASRMSLDAACSVFGIELKGAHRALVDARATAELLRALAAEGVPLNGTPSRSWAPETRSIMRTLRRDALTSDSMPLRRPSYRYSFPSSDDAELSYLFLLDSYLDDGVLDPREVDELARLAELSGLTPQLPDLHAAYFKALSSAAFRDGFLSTEERTHLRRIADALAVDLLIADVPGDVQREAPLELGGLRVCFTGEPIVDGRVYSREELCALASRHGLSPVDSLTKKGCDLLVAADLSSMSGKARKARGWGMPVISAEDFLIHVGARP